MAKQKDLFAPPSEEEILMSQEDDLFAAPSDEELLEDSEIENSTIPSEVKGTTIGALIGKGVQKPLEKIADILPSASERMAARSLGLYDTTEGRKFLREQMSQLGLPQGSITPEKIGRMALDENWLGTFGMKSAADQLDQVDESMRESLLRKQNLLDEIQGTKELSKVTKRTEELLGPLDIDLDPDAPKIEKELMKEFDKSFDEEGNFRPKFKTAKELEDAKVKLQQRQKYQATRADSASDRIEKARARALRESVDELADQAGLGEDFTNVKAEIGSKGVARNVVAGKALKDLKSADLDLTTSGSLALGRPEIPIAKTVIRKGKGVAAKGMDIAGKALNTRAARVMLKSLPIIGAFAGYEAARAQGLDPDEAVARVAVEEGTSIALGPFSALFGGDVGPNKNTPGGRLERGEATEEDYKKLAKDQLQVFNDYFVKEPNKVNLDVLADEIRTKTGADPIANQLTSIQREQDPRRKKAKMSMVQKQPAYKKVMDILEKEYANSIKQANMSEEAMSVDPMLQKNEIDINELGANMDFTNEDPTTYNYDNLSFEDAFNTARSDQGNVDDGVFTWRGKKYSTEKKADDLDKSSQSQFFSPQTDSVSLEGVNKNLLKDIEEVSKQLGYDNMQLSSGVRDINKTKAILESRKSKKGINNLNKEEEDIVNKILLRGDSPDNIEYPKGNWYNKALKDLKSIKREDLIDEITEIRKDFGGYESGHLKGNKVDIPYSYFVYKYGEKEGIRRAQELIKELRKKGLTVIDEKKAGQYGVIDIKK